MISTLLTVLKNLPELIRLTFLVFASPFYNIFLSLRYGCLIHPLARISPRVRFGKGYVVGKSKLITYYGGQITVGNYTTIHEACEFFAHRSTHIQIGDDCMLAKRTIIMTRNHVFDDPNQKIVNQGTKDKDVRIGSDVWTGLDTKILPGVTIGDGCVIGTGAVVTKDIPPKSVAVGVPARVIKKRGE